MSKLKLCSDIGFCKTTRIPLYSSTTYNS